MKKEDISKVIEMILTSLNDEAKSQNNECEKCHSIGILNYRDTMSGKNEIINCDMCEGVGLLSIDVLLKKIKSQEDEIKSLRGTVNIFELSENEKLRIENKELKEKYAHSEDRILALEKLVSKSVYPIKLKGQEDIQNQEDLEFCIAGIVSGYEGKIKDLESNYEHRLAKEITNYKEVITKRDAEINEYKEKIKSLEEEISSYKKNIFSLIDEYSETYNDREEFIRNLEKENEALKNKIEEISPFESKCRNMDSIYYSLAKILKNNSYPIEINDNEKIDSKYELELFIKKLDKYHNLEKDKYRRDIKSLKEKLEFNDHLDFFINRYGHNVASEKYYYKKEVERLNELLKEKSNENKISLQLDKEGISNFINKKKVSFVSTDTNSVGTNNNKDSLTSLDKIKQKDPYLYKAINGLIEYISLCYSDKYYKDGNFTDMDKFMMESEYSDGFIIGNMAKYLTRYSGDLNKLVDLYKLIHYGLLSLRKKFKDNEK